MDAILSVEKEVDRVLNKFNDFSKYTNDTLTDLISSLQSLRDNYSELFSSDAVLTETQLDILKNNIQKIREILQKISSQHKDLHSSVSKIGKQIDKNFYSEFQCVSNEQQFFINLSETNKFTRNFKNNISKDEDADIEKMEEDLDLDKIDKNKSDKLTPSKQLMLINKVILQHLLRVGKSDVANELTNEALINVEDTIKWPFNELNVIVEALKKWDLDPALEWALNNEEELNKKNSVLIFKLYKLKFIEMLKKIDEEISKKKKKKNDANSLEEMICEEEDEDIDIVLSKLQQELISFARTNFQSFFNKYAKEIQQLMCCLLYLPSGIKKCPYKNLFMIDESEVVDLFTHEACSLLGLSVESPLIVTFNAGCTALPALLNIRQVMQQRQVTGVWNCRDELPIGIDLGKEGQYHSIFSCPILKEQSKESNPPMRLTCGHVISRDALNKLTNGSKLKCPYCPQEQSPSDAKQIVF